MRTDILKKVIIIPAAVVGLMVPLTACVAGAPASSNEKVAATTVAVTGATDECEHVDAPMLDIPGAGDNEPQLRIPQPSGWEPTSEFDEVDTAVRFAITTADGEPSHDFAVVTVDLMPDLNVQAIFDDYRGQLMDMLAAKNLPMNIDTTATTVCGLPAETLNITSRTIGMGGALGGQRGVPATQLVVAAKVGGQTYLVSLVTGAAPDSAELRREIATILRGFEVLPPAASQRL